MTLGDMLRRLRVRLNDTEEPHIFSKELLVSWLQGMYMSIQLESEEWYFLRQRGELFRTEAGAAEYDLPNIKTINPGSLYYRDAGSTTNQPLCLGTYQQWVDEQTTGALTDGPPRDLIHTPERKWRLDPVPNGVYVVYGDALLQPAEFPNMEAEPIWDSQYHEIVLLAAFPLAADMLPKSPIAAAMLNEYATRYLPLRNAFVRRYLPRIGSAAPML